MLMSIGNGDSACCCSYQAIEIPQYIAISVLNGWRKDSSMRTDSHLVSLETGGKLTIVGTDISVDIGDMPVAEGKAKQYQTIELITESQQWHCLEQL